MFSLQSLTEVQPKTAMNGLAVPPRDLLELSPTTSHALGLISIGQRTEVTSAHGQAVVGQALKQLVLRKAEFWFNSFTLIENKSIQQHEDGDKKILRSESIAASLVGTVVFL